MSSSRLPVSAFQSMRPSSLQDRNFPLFAKGNTPPAASQNTPSFDASALRELVSQMREVPSVDQEKMRVSSLPKTAPATGGPCFRAAPAGWPDRAFQIPNVPSSDQDRMRVPSAKNAAPLTLPACCITAPTSSPVAASHRRKLRSSDQERIRFPSGLKSAPPIGPSCVKGRGFWPPAFSRSRRALSAIEEPSSVAFGGASCSPVAASNSRRRRSAAKERMRPPSGLSVTPSIVSRCAMGRPMDAPFAASKTRIDLSSDQETMRRSPCAKQRPGPFRHASCPARGGLRCARPRDEPCRPRTRRGGACRLGSGRRR